MATMTVTVEKEGHATIPADLLRLHGIQPGSTVTLSLPSRLHHDRDLDGVPIGDVIKEYEALYGMSSEELQSGLASGAIDEDAPIMDWVGLLRTQEKLRDRGHDPEGTTLKRVPPPPGL